MRGCFPSLMLFTVDTVAANVQMEVDITKDTGERRASRQAIYKCQDAWQGVPHYKVYQFKAERIEKIVFQAIAEYIDKLQENEDIFEQISENGRKAKKEKNL